MATSGSATPETSPHAWSKPPFGPCHRLSRGNISTCVEQTVLFDFLCHVEKKHLHMRGANLSTVQVHGASVETSPHAWSKQGYTDSGEVWRRNISTCVEQTQY